MAGGLHGNHDPAVPVPERVRPPLLQPGRGQGEARGKAEALLAFLDARNVHVPDDIRADIAACTDIDQLDEWIRRAATADKIQDVLD